MKIRIDQLEPLTKVELDFHDKWERIEYAVFVKIHDKGENREAEFISLNSEGDDYSWHAYRYRGCWSYGTSGDRLSLVRVIG